MKNNILILIVIILIVAAVALYWGLSRPVFLTPAMTASMEAHAARFDVWYPDASRNVARLCLDAPGDLYINRTQGIIALTCAIPDAPGTYGVVTFEDGNVLDVFTIQQDSDAAVARSMNAFGYSK